MATTRTVLGLTLLLLGGGCGSNDASPDAGTTRTEEALASDSASDVARPWRRMDNGKRG